MRDLTLRRSQTISPFGVGAICLVNSQSFVGVDTNHWPNTQDQIDFPRLANFLGVKYFKPPPTMSGPRDNTTPGIPYSRFPRWLFCPECRKMVLWQRQNERLNVHPECNENHKTTAKLVPMRFIAICENGHMRDIPWVKWAHSRAVNYAQKQCAKQQLEFRIIHQRGAGLGSLVIHCSACKSARSLQDISNANSIKGMGSGDHCEGSQPWETRKGRCDADLHVVQAGAGNVYFPQIASALYIPGDSDSNHKNAFSDQIRMFHQYPILRRHHSSAPNSPATRRLTEIVARSIGCSEEDVRSVLQEEDIQEDRAEKPEQVDKLELLKDEWVQFTNPNTRFKESAQFVVKHVEFKSKIDPGSPTQKLRQVVKATKLREIRALQGFSRYVQSTDPDTLIKPHLEGDVPWLPAIEVFGEGIFISFDERQMVPWENHPNLKSRSSTLVENWERSKRSSWLPAPYPRFVALHTFAHLLIRQLSFECGYSSSALRERIYSSKGNSDNSLAGVLIYTASGDSEGTLGGLVRLAEPTNIDRIVRNALDKSMWCSNDPVCQEVSVQGFDGLNLAACHACVLIPETSCIYGNCLLDRMMTTGDHQDNIGFFDEVWSPSVRPT